MNDDADDAAILARRQRLIALALSSVAGLATSACRPQPCLSIGYPEEGAGKPEAPEAPETPEAASPETTAAPETPETPETPAIPETPATPETSPK